MGKENFENKDQPVKPTKRKEKRKPQIAYKEKNQGKKRPGKEIYIASHVDESATQRPSTKHDVPDFEEVFKRFTAGIEKTFSDLSSRVGDLEASCSRASGSEFSLEMIAEILSDSSCR